MGNKAREVTIVAPLYVQQSKKKKFFFNLNVFRNTYFGTLNTVKKKYKLALQDQIKALKPFNTVTITYTLYPKTKRLCDLDNVLSIHAKFAQDALVEGGILSEDNYTIVQHIHFHFGEIDKHFPRVEIKITELTESKEDE